jgi:hypothetical protein
LADENRILGAILLDLLEPGARVETWTKKIAHTNTACLIRFHPYNYPCAEASIAQRHSEPCTFFVSDDAIVFGALHLVT